MQTTDTKHFTSKLFQASSGHRRDSDDDDSHNHLTPQDFTKTDQRDTYPDSPDSQVTPVGGPSAAASNPPDLGLRIVEIVLPSDNWQPPPNNPLAMPSDFGVDIAAGPPDPHARPDLGIPAPAAPCPACGSPVYWVAINGEMFCHGCKPPPRPVFVARRLLVIGPGPGQTGGRWVDYEDELELVLGVPPNDTTKKLVSNTKDPLVLCGLLAERTAGDFVDLSEPQTKQEGF